MKTLGICFGATTVQYVKIDASESGKTIETRGRVAHDGDPKGVVLRLLAQNDMADVKKVAVTGRAFRSSVDLSTISEPEAVECALREIYPEGQYPNLVISSGGETQLVYVMNSKGGISSVQSGNKCASGTGEFFLQQIRRMGLTLEEAVELAKQGAPHKIAGRCSVFCKSDCTHALNKGEPRANIAAGLCLMMADKIGELIKDIESDKTALIGGGSLNTAMVKILRERLEKRSGTLDVPSTAAVFEAYGAALWAADNDCIALPQDHASVIHDAPTSFGRHQPLNSALDLVSFKSMNKGSANEGDECVMGLDVGSTTTKAVLMRREDKAVLASIYLRTNGDPVQASRNCYKAVSEQVGGTKIEITGLGVTGSGRQIAALHALTDNVINEIIAHATAASYFDREVDTIFEIGGQDAKYTYLTGGVPSDYAMNEACSAGTGSFLEESARESLNVLTEEIGEKALQGDNPPNFTDQCSAFISSDIKTAGQEGIGKNDILSGLVYSVCLNYINRVKGSRPVGRKIFMQGGVCYNKAVPVAMASLMRHEIIVPPEPGLMGAFGVALETANRMELKLTETAKFDLDELTSREATREGSFVCVGGKEKCDRKCEISRIRVNGKLYPFGGVCNKYYNMRLQKEVEVDDLDLVAVRQKLLFEKYGISDEPVSEEQDKPSRTVGIMRTFLTHAMYPIYSNFFHEMGFKVVLSDAIDPEGIARIEAAFCLPAELTHGGFLNLLKKKLDYIFLPQISQISVQNPSAYTKACVFVQAEPYYLKATFRREIEESTTAVLSPVLRMDGGYERAETPLVEMAVAMGVSAEAAKDAYAKAVGRQRAYDSEMQNYGSKALKYLDEHPDTFGLVIFGRPYNSFASDANMGIPHKAASRGFIVIPFDMLPAAEYKTDKKMYWGMGQKIMKAAQFVKERENLFGIFITNFSCGPDSFVLSYFRNLMKTKPSLTLELDQHTADAGIDTRIEAAVDIMQSYRRISKTLPLEDNSFVAARVEDEDMRVKASDGKYYSLQDPRVELVLPSMGRYGTEAVAAIFRSMGVDAHALPVADKEILNLGKKNSTCKECVPYIVTTGSYLHYLNNRKDPNRITLFFMATGGGPCRLGQYCRAVTQHIENNKIPNAAVFTMTDENGYGGLGTRRLLRAWQSIVISDVFSDMRSMLTVTASDKKQALDILEECWQELIRFFEGSVSGNVSGVLTKIAKRLSQVPLKTKLSEVPVVSLIGEIFVRRDEFCRQTIVNYLEDRGFTVKVAPISEFLCYSNFVINSKLDERQRDFKEMLRVRLTSQLQEWWERRIKSILAQSGLYHFEMVEVEKTIEAGEHLINVNFRGEAILTVGLALREILNDSCGVISIGPFGCMPSRVAEAILKKEMNVTGKARLPGWKEKAHEYEEIGEFPFLAVETDGSPFPQLIEANMEAFVLQAKRLHEFHKQRKSDVKQQPETFSSKLQNLVSAGSFGLISRKK
ncbi:MAG: acyl-CoA dehydratase activase [Chitinispirillales bacterium]|jgi:predicted CoA-substrate-specific enzyme activase|nr:acyl-CoA dehydratase activase [Chitinispirillales bacterium]